MTRVIIVDDKADNLNYLRVLLEGHGYEVETAEHGAEAFARARQRKPDLVISDLLMPVMDGYTLLRQWRSDDQLARVPFMVYTATYTAREDEQLAIDLGADAFVLKPAEPEVLMTHVRAVLESGRVRQSSIGATEDTGHLREYSQVLVHKLEHKTLQLERANQQLEGDLAARKEIELALRDSEERLRQLAESVEDVFWLSSATSQTLCYVSPAYEVVWGRSRASLEADPLSWMDAVHPDDRSRVIATFDQYAEGTWDETYRILHPDGSTRWVRTRAYPVRDRDGVVYRIAGVSRDITQYRQLEEQFRQAQKLEAVGQLAGGVAHDFNNMLSVILSYASMVLDDLPIESPVRPDIEEILNAGERATGLTRQLLTFCRRQGGQPRVIDISEVVRELEKMLRRLLGEDIALVLVLAGQPLHVNIDPTQLEQSIVNLAINARDAMPRGGELRIGVDSVEISAGTKELRPGRYAQLVVADTGVGMDAATLERIFDPFFTTKEFGKGTGLGLSTVLGSVKQSHGDVEVTSTPGVGTSFRLLFPLTERAVERSSNQATNTSNLGTETLLIVEDDQQVREMCRTILSRHGYRTLDARNGVEALAVADVCTDTLHLLVTDVVMPRMGGRDLATQLLASRPELKVLYISGYSDRAIVEQAAVDPDVAVLQKPITTAALLRKVREILDGP